MEKALHCEISVIIAILNKCMMMHYCFYIIIVLLRKSFNLLVNIIKRLILKREIRISEVKKGFINQEHKGDL